MELSLLTLALVLAFAFLILLSSPKLLSTSNWVKVQGGILVSLLVCLVLLFLLVVLKSGIK